MNQKRVALESFFGEDARRLLVDGEGEVALGFCAVDGSVGCGVENEVGGGAIDKSSSLIGVGEIDRFAIDCDNGAGAGEDALKLAAELTGIANNEDAWICGRICCLDRRFAHAGELRRTWKCTFCILIGRVGLRIDRCHGHPAKEEPDSRRG